MSTTTTTLTTTTHKQITKRTLFVRTSMTDGEISDELTSQKTPTAPTDATTVKCIYVQALTTDLNDDVDNNDIFTYTTMTHKPSINSNLKLLSIQDENKIIVRVLSCSILNKFIYNKDVWKSKLIQEGGLKMDICGVVENTSSKIKGFKNGDIVVAVNVKVPMCGISEYVIVNEEEAVLKPPTVDVSEAAACSSAVTSIHALEYLNVGDRVLIIGGSNDIGLPMIQIMKLYGASYIVTTSTNSRCCMSQGSDEVIDPDIVNYWEMDEFKKQKFDKIFDTVGRQSKYAAHVLKKEKEGGMFIDASGLCTDTHSIMLPHWYKAITIRPLWAMISHQHNKKFNPKCVTLFPHTTVNVFDLKKVLKLMEEDKLRIQISERSPLPFNEDGVKIAFENIFDGNGCNFRSTIQVHEK